MWIWLQVTNERNWMQTRILKCNCSEFLSFHVFLCLMKFIFESFCNETHQHKSNLFASLDYCLLYWTTWLEKIDFTTTSTTQFHHLHSRIFLKKLNPSFSHHGLLTHKGERSFLKKNSIQNMIQLQNILYYIFIITKTWFFVNIISIKLVMKSEIE